MASLQDIRRRIRSVKNTQQVTKAMSLPWASISQSSICNQAKSGAQVREVGHGLEVNDA